MNKANISTGPLTTQLMQAVGQAIRRVNELKRQRIVTPGATEEIQAATQFVSHILTQHADELVGTWLACNREYTPLVEGIAALLRRAHVVNERLAMQFQAQQEAKQAAPVGAGIIIGQRGIDKAKCDCPEGECESCESEEKTAAAVISGEAPANTIAVNFGEATKTGAPIAPVTP